MTTHIARRQLIGLLNEDLSREYQAVTAYVIYSQVLKGAEYMAIAKELEAHAKEELQHAMTIAKHIDYLGGMPTSQAFPVKISDDPVVMLRADLDNESTTIRHYRERVKQCEALEEYAIAEDIREILRQEQEHQIDLATALGEGVPDMSASEPGRDDDDPAFEVNGKNDSGPDPEPSGIASPGRIS
jgi:bacterioferritin